MLSKTVPDKSRCILQLLPLKIVAHTNLCPWIFACFCYIVVAVTIIITHRYGIPLSFVYCTIYQQDIWREGDEKLVIEQKRVWRDFFSIIDSGYNAVASQVTSSKKPSNLNIAGNLDKEQMKACWNAHVMKNFSKLAQGSLANSIDLTGLTKSLGLSK